MREGYTEALLRGEQDCSWLAQTWVPIGARCAESPTASASVYHVSNVARGPRLNDPRKHQHPLHLDCTGSSARRTILAQCAQHVLIQGEFGIDMEEMYDRR